LLLTTSPATGGTQKTLASVASTGVPSASGPPVAPTREIVDTTPPFGPNAPCWRCSQVSNGNAHDAVFRLPARHEIGGSAKASVRSASRQKPQKTRGCVPDGTAVHVTGSVEKESSSGTSSSGCPDGGQS